MGGGAGVLISCTLSKGSGQEGGHCSVLLLIYRCEDNDRQGTEFAFNLLFDL